MKGFGLIMLVLGSVLIALPFSAATAGDPDPYHDVPHIVRCITHPQDPGCLGSGPVQDLKLS